MMMTCHRTITGANSKAQALMKMGHLRMKKLKRKKIIEVELSSLPWK